MQEGFSLNVMIMDHYNFGEGPIQNAEDYIYYDYS